MILYPAGLWPIRVVPPNGVPSPKWSNDSPRTGARRFEAAVPGLLAPAGIVEKSSYEQGNGSGRAGGP